MESQPLFPEPLSNVAQQQVPVGTTPGDVIRIINLNWSTPVAGQMTVQFNVVDAGGQPLVADTLTLSWGYDTSYSETPVVQSSASTFSTTLSVNVAEDVTVYLRADASAAVGNAGSRLATAWTLDQTMPGIAGYTWNWSRAASGAPALADLVVDVDMDGTKGNAFCQGQLTWIGNVRNEASPEAYGADPHRLTFLDLPDQVQFDLEATVFDRSGNSFLDAVQQDTSPNYSPPQVLSHTVDVSGTSITYNIEVDKDCDITIVETVQGGAQEDSTVYPITAGAVRQIISSVLQQNTVYDYSLTPVHPLDGSGTTVAGSFTSGVGALNWVTLPVWSTPQSGDGLANIILASASVDNPPDQDWEYSLDGGAWTPLAGTSGQATLTNVSIVTDQVATEAEVGTNWNLMLRATVTGTPLTNSQNVPKPDYKIPVSTPTDISVTEEQTGSGVGRLVMEASTWDEPVTLRTRVNGGTWTPQGPATSFAQAFIASNLPMTGTETYNVDIEGTDAAGNVNIQAESVSAPDYGPPVISGVSDSVSGTQVTIDYSVDKDCDVTYTWTPDGGAQEGSQTVAATVAANPNQIVFLATLQDQLYDYALTPDKPVYGTGATVNGQVTTEAASIAWVQQPVYAISKIDDGLAEIRIQAAAATNGPDSDWEYNLDGGGWTAISGTAGAPTLTDQLIATGLTATEVNAGGTWNLQLRASAGADTIADNQDLTIPDYLAPVYTPAGGNPGDDLVLEIFPSTTIFGNARCMLRAHTWSEVVSMATRVRPDAFYTWPAQDAYNDNWIADRLVADGVTSYTFDVLGTDAAGNQTQYTETILMPNYSSRPTNVAPVWVTTALTGTPEEGVPFAENFAGYAEDPDAGQTITYRVVDADGTDANFVGTVLQMTTHTAGPLNLIIEAQDDGEPQLETNQTFSTTVTTPLPRSMPTVSNNNTAAWRSASGSRIVTDTTSITMVMYLSIPNLTTELKRIIQFGSGVPGQNGNWTFEIYLENGNNVEGQPVIRLRAPGGGAIILEAVMDPWAATINVPFQLVVSVDMSGGSPVVTGATDGINRNFLPPSGTAPNVVTWNEAVWCLMNRHSDSSISPHNDVAFIGAHPGYIDLTQAANRAIFWDSTNGRPVDPGPEGVNYFGEAARLWKEGNAAAWNSPQGIWDTLIGTATYSDDGSVDVT